MNNINLKEIVEQTHRAMAKNMAEKLYGDNSLFKELREVAPPTMWQRCRAFLSRAHDAWLVLTGRLDPYDSW